MPFLNLSNELITEILWNLCLPRDLVSISVCNKHLNALVIPILYSTFKQTRGQALPAFLRTLASKPYLAGHVKDFTVTAFSGYADRNAVPASMLTKKELVLLRQFIPVELLGDTFCYNVLNIPDEHLAWDALATVALLACLATVHDIKIYVQRRVAMIYLTRIFALGRVPLETSTSDLGKYAFFSKIQRLSIISLDKILRAETHQIITECFKITTIPNITLINFAESPSSYSMMFGSVSDSPTQIKTQELDIQDSQLSPPLLKSMLTHFFALRCFRYEHGDSWGLLLPSRLLIPRTLKEGLYNSRHSLEELVLSDRDYPWGETREDDLRKLPFGSMIEFARLKIMDVEIEMLAGKDNFLDTPHTNSDEEDSGLGGGGLKQGRIPQFTPEQVSMFLNALPPALEYLTIRKCMDSVWGCIYELLNRSKTPPKLHTIKLCWNMGGCYFSEEDWHQYKGLALKKGIKLIRD
ncbi:hypothetical protein BGZ60DRAFT_422993 [Tricladium varicosporioides]|nr:hypothetical protein BGZ60DRAFT_422993 [Hymenoscyphus varicosporioides]